MYFEDRTIPYGHGSIQVVVKVQVNEGEEALDMHERGSSMTEKISRIKAIEFNNNFGKGAGPNPVWHTLVKNTDLGEILRKYEQMNAKIQVIKEENEN